MYEYFFNVHYKYLHIVINKILLVNNLKLMYRKKI